jgi:hypothetical protein
MERFSIRLDQQKKELVHEKTNCMKLYNQRKKKKDEKKFRKDNGIYSNKLIHTLWDF